MKAIFADTSFYAACLMQRDAHHTRAATLAEVNRSTILTTEFVVVELLNLFSKVPGRRIVVEFVNSLRKDPDTLILPVSSGLMERGFKLFSGRSDKEWSLTDCVSFVVMEEHGITDALTSDGHFEQAGFKVLLK